MGMGIAEIAALAKSRRCAFTAPEPGTRRARLDIVGPIYEGGGADYQSVLDQCRAGDFDELEVHLCSPGGETGEGLAIYSLLAALRAAGKKVCTYADGVVASIASVIFQAGEVRTVAASGMLHLHHAWTIECGNARTLTAVAGELEKIDASIAAVYRDRSGRTDSEIAGLMDGPPGADGTILTAAEAVEAKLADAIVENVKALAAYDLADLGFAPAEPAEPAEPEEPEEPAEPAEPEEPEEPEPPKPVKPVPAALRPAPADGSAVKNFRDALAACGGNYVRARREFPAAYAALMRGPK